MHRLESLRTVSLLVWAVSLVGAAQQAMGQICPCDLANADVAPCPGPGTGPDGIVGFSDLQFMDYCVANQADFCGRDLSVCDLNCDGAVDYRDYGEAFEAFSTGVSSGACVGAYGACCGVSQTNCVLTTGTTCNVLAVPDVVPGDGVYSGDGTFCTPNPCDCNGNAIADSLDLADGFSLDCNGNRLPDECDISIGASPDTTPPNSVPDECDPLNRYLFFSMNDLVPTAAEPYAIRVKLLSVNGFAAFDGETRWAGPAVDSPDEDAGDPTRTFTTSTLRCDSVYADWGTSNLVYITGGEILPESAYAIQAIAQSCDEASEACYTPEAQWTVTTAAWGDTAAPFAGNTASQPSFQDITAVVSKFLGVAGFPTKARFQLVPNTPAPNVSVNFQDISAGVEAFLGAGYIDHLGSSGPVGPCVCPSAVTCGTTPCTITSDCNAVGGGFCVDNFCTDMCRRCSP